MGYCVAMRKVLLNNKAKKGLNSLPIKLKQNAFLFLKDLKQGANPPGWNIKKTGENEYRARINYRHRIRYFLDGEIIKVFYIGPREGAYK